MRRRVARACRHAYDRAAVPRRTRRGAASRDVAALAYAEAMATRRPTAAPYRCTECGWTTLKWVGRCGECQQWGTVVEASEPTGHHPLGRAGRARRRPRGTADHRRSTRRDAPRRTTGVGEFDRVLGGGIVPGAAILLSGEPGVGKSTLLLEVAAQSARAGRRVLYASAEESTAQVRLRAERTGALHDELYIAAETDLATILGHVDEVRPELLIVDSVQTVSSAMSEGMAGHPSQVREVASTLIRIAKDRGLPVIIVGHVTKDGSIAGPAHPRAPRRRRVPVRGRPADVAAIRARAQEPLRPDGRGRMLRHDRRRASPRCPTRARCSSGTAPPSPARASRSRSRAGARCRSRCRRSRSRRRRPIRAAS